MPPSVSGFITFCNYLTKHALAGGFFFGLIAVDFIGGILLYLMYASYSPLAVTCLHYLGLSCNINFGQILRGPWCFWVYTSVCVDCVCFVGVELKSLSPAGSVVFTMHSSSFPCSAFG
jgi:hypothetical protein